MSLFRNSSDKSKCPKCGEKLEPQDVPGHMKEHLFHDQAKMFLESGDADEFGPEYWKKVKANENKRATNRHSAMVQHSDLENRDIGKKLVSLAVGNTSEQLDDVNCEEDLCMYGDKLLSIVGSACLASSPQAFDAATKKAPEKTKLEAAKIKKDMARKKAEASTSFPGKSSRETGDPDIDKAMVEIHEAENKKKAPVYKVGKKKGKAAKHGFHKVDNHRVSSTSNKVGGVGIGTRKLFESETSEKVVCSESVGTGSSFESETSEKVVRSESVGTGSSFESETSEKVVHAERVVAAEPIVAAKVESAESVLDVKVVSAEADADAESVDNADDDKDDTDTETVVEREDSPPFQRRTSRFLLKKLKTGRVGEEVAFNHFSSVLRGKKIVTWVNADEESGRPYDILVEDVVDKKREYIEVKSTSVLKKKDWFFVTMNELDFALDHGESYSIARVVLVPRKSPRISAVYTNPVKLFRSGELKLAIHPLTNAR